MTDERLQALHRHLAETGERPVERTASRWLGEAEAVAADIAAGELSEDVLAERLITVDHILSHVESTADAVADDHVDAAREIVDTMLDEL
ncbi:hypothetical protein BVU17_11905 [Haloarcula taiwanensis]|uniref:DUF8152 domain-containing protein n=1 Tax=Haloarcula taiwanensis TaxID=1932004 RepID=A0A2H5A0C5_9EURY|nr:MULTISPECIES: hypothetical protein [Haloarcula]AUG48192.1 hypothetical protein BVU17_11905 [Haloarcula taiwanensis]RLM39548.1 hypothetical protein DVK01_03015 [Haloarcula sp. Atlit-120R]RLM47513.1 hypothetical protein DVK00_03115 [Haloarcula sp. Atlit-47R]